MIEHGANDIATVFDRAFELAMQIERERFLGAGHYERTAGWRGYAPGRAIRERIGAGLREVWNAASLTKGKSE